MKALQKHQESLEILDIYSCDRIRDCVYELECLGALGGFWKLQYLYIQPEVLLKVDSSPSESPTFARGTPLSRPLRSLTLYSDNGPERLSDLSIQIADALNSSRLPTLRYLNIQTTNTVLRRKRVPSYLQEALQKANVTLTSQSRYTCTMATDGDNCKLPMGGSCPRLWKETQTFRNTGYGRRNRFKAQIQCFEDLVEDAGDDGVHYTTGERHAVPFSDHAGQQSIMVFKCDQRYAILPPLFSLAFYFTYAGAAAEDMELAEFYNAVPVAYILDTPEPRADCYFLPGASTRDCARHYCAEIASRGSFVNQIRDFNHRWKGGLSPPEAPGNLPGMVNAYYGGHRALFICKDPDWRTGQRTLQYVVFGYFGLEDWTAETDDDLEEETDNEKMGHDAEKVKADVGSPEIIPYVDPGEVEEEICTLDKDHPLYDGEYVFTVDKHFWDLQHDRRDGIAGIEIAAISAGWRNW